MAEIEDPVVLDVGGVRYSTTYSTLTLYPDSMLGRMFGGGLPLKINKDGAVFIDRNGALFKHILDFLRCGRLSLPRTFPEMEALKIEADFFQISPLIEALNEHSSKDPVRLNVGGKHFAAFRDTLTKYPDSYLGRVVRGVTHAEFDEEGRIFIDRDGALFRHVINFLRTDRLSLPDNFRDFGSLEEEAVFYQISPLTEALKKLRSRNRIIEIVESTDFGYPSLVVDAPDKILHHPELFPSFPNRFQARDFGGYWHFPGKYKVDFRRFLEKIGCQYLDHSLSIGPNGSEVSERWLAPWYLCSTSNNDGP